MSSLEEFVEDPGTMWTSSGDRISVRRAGTPERKVRRELRKRAGKSPIVWLVDDEQLNRTWFVDQHSLHFAVITFSGRKHVLDALQARIPCDILVTDVFFPAETPTDEQRAKKLLDIYTSIEHTTIAQLDELWPSVRTSWKLDGFDIATDVAEWAKRNNEKIPVVLYSRKAPLLLTDEEWLVNAEAVQNTYWMTEKLDPSKGPESSRRIAGIQRNRIGAYLSLKQKSAPWWMQILSGVGIGYGPFSYSLGAILNSK